MRHTWKTKCFAWVLAGAIAASGLPSVSLAAEGNEPAKLADFDFNTEAAGGTFNGGNALAAQAGLFMPPPTGIPKNIPKSTTWASCIPLPA